MVALNYASTINGFTHINLTKLDVLSGLETLRIGVGYKLPDGTVTTDFPSDIDLLGQVENGVRGRGGGGRRISRACGTGTSSAAAAQKYVLKIEELCGVECRYLGRTGRDAIVIKP